MGVNRPSGLMEPLVASPAQRLSHVHGPTEPPLLEDTIGRNLERAVVAFGDRDALVVCDQGVRLSYDELWALTSAAAKGLIATGVRPGDRVGIWAPNRYEWVVVQYATARIGAVLVNVNPAYKASELEHALRGSGVSVLLHAEGFRTTNYVEVLAEVVGNCPQLRDTFVLEHDWDPLLAQGAVVGDATLAAIEGTLEADDPINIQYTSGTTGLPKGATLSHRNILNNGYLVGERLAYTQQDRVCVPVPLYHCFGMVLGNLACTSHGSCVVLPSASFDAGTVLRTLEAERCTSVYGVPTMFIEALNHLDLDSFDLSSMRTGIMSGSPCPVEVMRQVRTRMHIPDITITYGMTEASPVTNQTALDDSEDKRVTTVGRPQAHVEIKLIDPADGSTTTLGQPGEVCMRGYNIMIGYWEDPDATADAIDESGWLHSGDLGTMDADGYLQIVGRIKDMIIRGGENISPREIEEFLHRHPDVVEVQVIGVPSEKYGEEVMAWVRTRPGAQLDGEQLAAYCRGQIATFKIPRFWQFVDSFPMTVTGKIQKFRLREQAAEFRDIGT
jgi:fatty-acyl-CoA synthase